MGVLSLCVLTLIGCEKQQEQTNIVKVAVSSTSPPMLYEENGVIKGSDLDLSKDNGENVASVEYSQKIPLVLNISACLYFQASTAGTKSKPLRNE